MADPILLKDAAVWLGGYDLSGFMNSINLAAAKAELPSNVFGDGAETFVPGLEQITAEGGGFWSAESLLAPDPVLFSRIDASQTPNAWPLVMVAPNANGSAANTEGNWGYVVVGREFGYQHGGAHGQTLPFSFKTMLGSGYKLNRQRLERARASVSVTTTSTGFQYGALSSSQKMVATFHVFAISGTGAWTLTIESDDNSGFTTAVTRATFTSVDQTDDPATEVVEIAGPVTDDYWRAVLTEDSGTSTITFAVTLGIARA